MRKLSPVLAVLLLAACGDSDDTTDPWQSWLNSPGPAAFEAETGGELSREDAQTRARLGCGQEWIEGTVDYWLAETIGRNVC
jgi:hypothetical protein